MRLVEGQGIGWSWWPLKKFGHNNPLQIVPDPVALATMRYFAGEGPRPDVAQARAALLKLAARDVPVENNVQHPDVVDALIRQPHEPSAQPSAAMSRRAPASPSAPPITTWARTASPIGTRWRRTCTIRRAAAG
ncbi:hypothetical protein AB5I41_13270 [Sphingomonas sp. MMS24-JH45]